MLFCYLYKLTISIKQERKKVTKFLWKFFMWFSYLHSLIIFSVTLVQNLLIRKTVSGWNNNYLVVRHWSELLTVKGCRCRSVKFNWGFGNAVHYLSQWVQDKALIETRRVKPLKAQNFIYKMAYFSADYVYFLSKILLD